MKTARRFPITIHFAPQPGKVALTPSVLLFPAIDDGTCQDCGFAQHAQWCVHAPRVAPLVGPNPAIEAYEATQRAALKAVMLPAAPRCQYGGCSGRSAEVTVLEFAPGATAPFLKRPMCSECVKSVRKDNRGTRFETRVEPLEGVEQRDPNELPPGWRKTLWEGVDRFDYFGGPWVERPLPKNADRGDFCARGQWMRGSLHEAMRLARGLSTIAELWA